MITPLRRRHRWLAPGMCLVALVGMVVAVMARPSGSSTPGPSDVDSVLDAKAALVEHESGRFRVAVSAPVNKSREIWLLPSEALDVPDLLVYAVANADVDTGGELPTGAKLLGPAAQDSPTRLAMAEEDGGLLLFSLAHQVVEASISIPKAGQTMISEER